MTNSEDLFKLPAGLLSSGDPIEGNPFLKDDLRHGVWEDATRKAEEGLCRLNSESLKAPPPGPEAYIGWTLDLVSTKFDIWAKRNVQVVWSDGAVQEYDQWLFHYAESWLETMGKGCPAFVRPESFLTALRLRLVERREYWRAEARRYVAEHKAQARIQRESDRSEPLTAAEAATNEHKAQQTGRKSRGRPRENDQIYRLICEQHKKHKMQMRPRELADLPALKSVLQTYTNPVNVVSKALMWGRKNGLL